MDLQRILPTAAFAFRGYNTTNLGRTSDLLAHPAYGPIVQHWLERGSDVCAATIGRPVDLVERVRERRETDIDTYPDAVAMVVSVELAHVQLLRDFHGIDIAGSQAMFGYSLGEAAALMAAGVYEMEDLLPVPLGLSIDAADLAHDVTLGVLFSRGRPLVIEDVHRGCLHTNQEGRGVMGISSYLSPNSMLLMGQGDTLSRFKNWFDAVSPERTTLRKNKELWPPLHTPIMWERNISNRAAAMMHTIGGGFVPPQPPVWSMVTGRASYNDYNSREILGRWIDHPQRLWEVVYIALSSGVETIIHVGPEPNLIPATFKRMSDNVEVQTRGSLGMRALSTAVRRPWLKRVLPARTALLRAPLIEQVMLEDWLLENAPE